MKKTIQDDKTIQTKEISPAEPAALGLTGLAVAALVIGSGYLGVTSGIDKVLMIPWILFFGACAQLIAGLTDFKRNNIFGGTVFCVYSLTMFSIALTLFFVTFGEVNFDISHYGFGLIGILTFTLIATFASFMVNKILLFILIAVNIAVIGLIFHYLAGASSLVGGIFLVITSALSFYAVAAILINSMAKKNILPVGGPILKP